jgi:hypothetical protein
LEPLTGPDNYIPWLVGLEVLLRMHQVWCVAGELCVPLDKNKEMYPWYLSVPPSGDGRTDTASQETYRILAASLCIKHRVVTSPPPERTLALFCELPAALRLAIWPNTSPTTLPISTSLTCACLGTVRTRREITSVMRLERNVTPE